MEKSHARTGIHFVRTRSPPQADGLLKLPESAAEVLDVEHMATVQEPVLARRRLRVTGASIPLHRP